MEQKHLLPQEQRLTGSVLTPVTTPLSSRETPSPRYVRRCAAFDCLAARRWILEGYRIVARGDAPFMVKGEEPGK
jgi:hypothetical protein